MSTTIRATTSEQLSDINDVIHDYWFNVEDISYSPEDRQLRIRFLRPPLIEHRPRARGWGLFRTSSPSNVEAVLHIRFVKDWVCRESEGIGSYDFNVVRFSESDGRVSITTGVPLELHAAVDQLDVSVEV